MIKNIINYIYVMMIFIILFPGIVKMILGIATPLINIFSFIILFIIFIYKMKNKVYYKNNNLFVQYIYFIILLVSIYAFFSPNQIDILSFGYLIKAYIFLFSGIFIFYSLELEDVKRLFNLILFTAFYLTIVSLFMGIDYEKTNANYLTYAFLLGASIVLLGYDLLFTAKNFFSNLVIIFVICYFIINNLLTGSRGSLLFSLFLLLLMYLIKLKKSKLKEKMSVIIIFCLTLFSIFYFIIEKVEINSWFLFKMGRLFSNEITEEPRFELYANAYTYFVENFNLFGLGFNPSRYISTSLDDSWPFLESFPFELIFNFGIFGLLILIYKLILIIDIFKKDNYLYPITVKALYIYLFVLLNFSKGWSVYSGFVVFTLLAIVCKIYIIEREIKNEN